MDIHSEAYIAEAEELLSELESSLLELETSPEDTDLINRAFRALHTIKGSGAMFGFEDIARFTHEIETVFDFVRDGKIKITKKLINLTLQSCDIIKIFLKNTEQISAEDEIKAIQIVNSFREMQSEYCETEIKNNNEEIPKEISNEKLIKIFFKPEQNIFLTGTNPLCLLEELKGMGAAIIFGEIDNKITLDKYNPEYCYAGWNIILRTDRTENEIRDVFIFVEDQCELRFEEIAEKEENLPDIKFEELCECVFSLSNKNISDIESCISKIKKQINSTIAELNEVKQPAAEKETEANKSKKEKNKSNSAAGSNLKVSSEKLDRLVDLVGELVTVQSRLTQISAKYNLPDLTLISEEVERLTTDLRDNAMGIRMMPIGNTFTNFSRLVRDLSNELGKMVELQTEGAETELDKTVIDKLNEPLVHLIRNCIDHGIEMPEERRKKGKSTRGVIKLCAVHSGGDVLIKVSDDGAGLNPEKIKKKAMDKGLISKDAELTENEIFQMIMKPGFSTAENITNISGRGVGTDVVIKAIENLRGSLDIKSEADKGTVITLRIPLTLAIIEGLLVKISGSYYIFPLSTVKECVELTKDEIKKSGGRKMANVRGSLVPYINIREKFSIDGQVPEIQQVVITEVNERRIGFIVDQVIGEHQTVIKSLGKVYKNIKEISGATILGDGTLALILDLSKLIEWEENDSVNNYGRLQ